MDKCKGVGMKATWVMTDEEKQEKKEAAQARKRIKMLGIGGHQNNLVDSSDLPTSSYLVKRAQDRRCRKRQITGSSSRSLEIEEEETMSDEIENAGKKTITYFLHLVTVSNFWREKLIFAHLLFEQKNTFFKAKLCYNP